MDTTQTAPHECAPLLPRLVVCLGNPGAGYAENRHNTGFQVAARLLDGNVGSLTDWQPGNGDLYRVRTDSGSYLLLKPMTFMNSSGEAVVRVTGHLGISPAEVLVVCDCLDLPLGKLRMRPGGSCGGQNGVRSILAELGTEAVPRLRVGIGRPQSGECSIIDYVLADWTSDEREKLAPILGQAAVAVKTAVAEGLEAGMRCSNSWTLDINHAE